MKPFQTLELLRQRMSEALIAQSGLRHPGLTMHLRDVFVGADVRRGALLSSPVLEGAFPFTAGDETYGDLSGTLLHPRTVEALAGDGSSEEHVPLDRHPYAHQLRAFRMLSPTNSEPRSVVVTSGTGSGKTECFMVPLLDDLVRQEEAGGVGTGVQAIMLYPLNALIASQRERLDAWTAPLDGRVRYCLYNGLLPDILSAADERDSLRLAPQTVPNRKLLRQQPPPLLVTNLTMLEYILLRPQDSPILEASQGRLRWIVLDEAHTLVGAAAAEVALLLRRVMSAFAVDASAVRFVATSATIGEGEGTRHALKRFLADIGGIAPERVDVIEGHRTLPARPASGNLPTPEEIDTLEPAALYDRLGGDDHAWAFVERLMKSPASQQELRAVAAHLGVDAETASMALTRAKSAAGEVLAPLRVHSLHRAVPGLWSCTNPACGAAPPNWPHGRILFERAEACPHCTMPVAELESCNECGGAVLVLEERGGTLTPPLRIPPSDEFLFDARRDGDGGGNDEDEIEDGAESEQGATGTSRSLAVRHRIALNDAEVVETVPFFIGPDGKVRDVYQEGGYVLRVLLQRPGPCPLCRAEPSGDAGDKLFPFRFGAPFVIGNAMPILTAGMPPGRNVQVKPLPYIPPDKPFDGRQILTFTDSRQGTARMAAKLQSEAERAFARSFLYHVVQRSVAGATGPDAEKKRTDLENYRKAQQLGLAFGDQIRALEAELSGNTDGLRWEDVRSGLSARPEVEWIRNVWGERDALFQDRSDPAVQVAQMFMLREFLRRPRRANSVETLGLARLRCKAAEQPDSAVPLSFIAAGGSADDWRAWLSLILTFQLRANSVVRVNREMATWVMRHARPRAIAQQEPGPNEYRWPAVRPHGRQARSLTVLEHGLHLNFDDVSVRTDVSDWLDTARRQLSPTFPPDANGAQALDFEQLHVAPLVKAWVCPVTRNVIDIAPFGITPYARGPDDKAESITLPRLPTAADTEVRRSWLAEDEIVAGLRDRGIWSDVHDRIALFAPYARSAEHSAQLPRADLETYERDFKAAAINVLNCSTTMEMGVDIGSVNGVVMTNVPPSIANYRQRVGRAGRRGQPLSLAFTLAKDRPLDREAFEDPHKYLHRAVAAPRVALDSRPIVQRHVNALLLGHFLRDHHGNALSLKTGEFFGCPADPGEKRPSKAERPAETFRAWIDKPSTREGVRSALRALVHRSVLEQRTDLIETTGEEIRTVSDAFTAEWQGLRTQYRDEQGGAGAAIKRHLTRLCGEYLLSELADRGFLPGHGFPNNVVSFELDRDHKQSREDNRGRRHDGPKRPIDIAIREYAPGGEVVIDGLVYRSGGVTLNWQRPASDQGAREVQALRWIVRCARCGAFDTGVGDWPSQCEACGADVERRRYLKPASFLRDRHERVHADVEQLRFVAAEDAMVGAGSAQWQQLPDPQIGRLRASRTGTVVFHNRGRHGHGYGLCLICGRMEPMQAEEEVCSGLAEHKPLRAREGWSNPCRGNIETFAVQNSLDLGHQIQTDVFELQPTKQPSLPAAGAIAIALRETLAQRLGIETSEMGFAVKPARNSLGGQTRTLCLYDTAAGGAGYAVQAAHHLRSLLNNARTVLECRSAQCERACSACVLASDAADGDDAPDRHAALRFLNDHFHLPDDLPPADRFVAAAELSEQIVDEIDLRMQGGSSLDLWIEPVDVVHLTSWSMVPHMRRWTDHGHAVRLIATPRVFAELDGAQRLVLRDFGERHGVAFGRGEATRYANGGIAFAAVSQPARRTVWASRDGSLLRPDADWGAVHEHPVARGEDDWSPSIAYVEKDELKPPVGAKVVRLNGNVCGPISTFGKKMAASTHAAMSEVAAPSPTIEKAVYRDRYARAPLVLRLLIDTLATLAPSCPLQIETGPDRGGYSRFLLWSDIEDDEALRAFAKAYGAKHSLAVDLEVGSPPHKRTLELTSSSGEILYIDLDQGFGWVTYHGRDKQFDPNAALQVQVQRVVEATGNVLPRHGPSQMVVHSA